MALETLPITGFDGASVPNRFLRHEGPTDLLAVLLPGMGYSNDRPLMHYAGQLVRFTSPRGADVLGVDYAYQAVTDEAELRARMAADVGAALVTAMAQRREYGSVTLIGKSIGTIAMTSVLDRQIVGSSSRCVWLTPLLKRGDVRDRVLLHPGPSFIAIGTEDPHFDPAWLAQWQSATGGTLAIAEGGNHGLSIDRDVLRSIGLLGDVMAKLQEFLRRT